MEKNGLSENFDYLIERVAAYPHGLGFLHLADIETVAVLLGVSAYSVAEARDQLETRNGRKLFIRKVRKAKERFRAGDVTSPEWTMHALRRIKDPPPLKTPEQLVEDVREHELGISFLTKGPVETVAVTFEVHPDIVLKARAIVDNSKENNELEPDS